METILEVLSLSVNENAIHHRSNLKRIWRRVVFKRIIVLLDGSDLDDQALAHAISISESFQSELILLRVFESLSEKLSLPEGRVKEAEELTSNIACKHLEQLAIDVGESSILIRPVVLVGRPQKEVVRFVEKEQVDLIVICEHLQTGLSRWRLGSDVYRITRGVRVPVLSVKIHEQQN